jgi:sodium-dependent phosphate cotransporter
MTIEPKLSVSTPSISGEGESSVSSSPVSPSWIPRWFSIQGFGIVLLVLLLITAVSLIGLGVQGWAGGEARSLLQFVRNPFLGLVIGIFATALVQSSGLVMVIVVGLVAGGFPISLAISVVMGANIGTTVTNTLVSLFQKTEGEAFERSFAAATVHDFFNLLAVCLFFPLEQWLHPLERLSHWLIHDRLINYRLIHGLISHGLINRWLMPKNEEGLPGLGWGEIPGLTWLNPLDYTIVPVTKQLEHWANLWAAPWNHLALVLAGIGVMMVSLPLLSQQIRSLWSPAPKPGGWGNILVGAAITALVQSSSATTSLMVPLAGAGVLSLSQIYPFTLGANIGSCVTGLLSTIGLPTPLASVGLQIALVHLLYNCLAVVLIYSLPPLRSFPLTAATGLAHVARHQKPIAIVYVGLIFFGLPLICLWLSVATFRIGA